VKDLKTSSDVLTTLSEEDYRQLCRDTARHPVRVLEKGRRALWMSGSDLYWADDDLTQADVDILLRERGTQQRRRLDRAKRFAELAPGASAKAGRAPIADEVKIFVWQRDGGVCVSCGSKERLEFDHIIPLTMGGSNTARNLQLLCEPCNRAKGGNLG